MSKLQRAVEGQTIQFLPLPKIFNTLSADLPTGAVKLPNGDVAYWRLHRNLAELKKHRKNIKELTAKLAQALASLVNSDSFKNHYGVAEAPTLPSESQLVTLFRNLLQLNTSRVDYSSVSHGRNKPLVESIQVPLGNLVFFNAIRGVQSAPKVPGIKGKLWLKEGSDADQAFAFTIVSPVVELADFIGPDRLQQEILNKIKMNLPALAFNPKITFDEDQFKNYVGAGLQALGEKFAGQQGGGKKDKKARGATSSVIRIEESPIAQVEAPVVTGEPKPDDQITFELNPAAETPKADVLDAGALGAAVFVGETNAKDDSVQTDPLFLGTYASQEAFEQAVDPDNCVTGSWAMVAGQRVELTEQEVEADIDDDEAMQTQPEADLTVDTLTAPQAAAIAADARDQQRAAELGTVVLAASVFNELSTEDKGVYLAAVERKIAQPGQWDFVRKVLNSGIMLNEYKSLNDTLAPADKISHPVYLGRVIFQLTRDVIDEILGENDAFNKANGGVRN